MIKGGTKKQEPGNPAPGLLGYRFDRRVAGFIPGFCTPRFFQLDRPDRSGFDNLARYTMGDLMNVKISHHNIHGIT